jgi:hypothetical protein
MKVDNPIYALVPAVYRERDAKLGLPLEALTKVLNIEYEALRANIGRLYDQWFIETCDRWAVPYIGTLLGIEGIETDTANVPTQRARVANTVGYRARRGVAAILANACGDACGWPALAVEYFERVIISENVGALEWPAPAEPALNLRPATVDVGDFAALAALEGPFSAVSRTVSVSDIAQPKLHTPNSTSEYYNLPNIGLFFWRIRALPVSGATPGVPLATGGQDLDYQTFHPLGIDTPLFRAPDDRTNPWRPRTAAQIPMPITRRELMAMLESARRRPTDPTGPSLGFVIRCNGEAIPVTSIHARSCGSLEAPDTADASGDGSDPPPTVVVDPECGRFKVYDAPKDATITLDWTWGQPGWLGGGSYDRNASMVDPSEHTTVVVLSKTLRGGGHGVIHETLGSVWGAIKDLREQASMYGRPLELLIRVIDSATYALPTTDLELHEDDNIVIEALDGERPVLLSPDDQPLSVRSVGGNARLMLSGLLIGHPLELRGCMEVLVLDCTIAPPVPGSAADGELPPAIRWAADEAETKQDAAVADHELTLVRSIVGPVELDPGRIHLLANQTIIDAAGGPAVYGSSSASESAADASAGSALGPPVVLDAVSVLGSLRVSLLEAVRDTIITGSAQVVELDRALIDEVEFDLELGLGEASCRCHRPEWLDREPFSSTRYGDPGYCQLRLGVNEHLLYHASDDGEYGAYHALATGQRLANLVPVIEQYLPHGLRAGIFLMS